MDLHSLQTIFLDVLEPNGRRQYISGTYLINSEFLLALSLVNLLGGMQRDGVNHYMCDNNIQS
jgi:hypothetical protein